jgi:hypothetical protein
MIRAGVDPDLLGEVSWWATDDLWWWWWWWWWWSLLALVTYVRAAADRTGEAVPAVCERMAERHAVSVSAEAP